MPKGMKPMQPLPFQQWQAKAGEQEDETVVETEVDEVESEDEVVDEPEVEQEPSEEAENNPEPEEDESETDGKDEPEDDEDEVIVTIGDEEPPPQEKDEQKAPVWVRDLRKSHRELTRKNRELEDKLKARENPQPEVKPLGKKPKLEDFDYDADEFETALTKWHDDKRRADDEAKKAQAAQEEANKAWKAKIAAYDEAKSKLKVRDFDEAEMVIQDTFDATQQGIVLQGSDNPALTFYAIGKSEARAKELAAIKDPVKFTYAVAKLESQLKVSNRKAPPPPEKPVTGTGSKSGAVDSQLDRLRADAQKTGDYTKVIQYKKKQAAKHK